MKQYGYFQLCHRTKMVKFIFAFVFTILICSVSFGQDSVNVKDLKLIRRLESSIYAVHGYKHAHDQYIMNGKNLTYDEMKAKLFQCPQAKKVFLNHPYSFSAIDYYNYYYVFNGDSLVNAKKYRTNEERRSGSNRYSTKRDIRMLHRSVRRFNQSLSR